MTSVESAGAEENVAEDWGTRDHIVSTLSNGLKSLEFFLQLQSS